MQDSRPRCAACGVVIGVYEPLVMFIGDAAFETSLAREALDNREPKFHKECAAAASEAIDQTAADQAHSTSSEWLGAGE